MIPPVELCRYGTERDILGEWKAAAVKHGLKFGVSSHLYWSPAYLKIPGILVMPGPWSGNFLTWITVQVLTGLRIAGTSIGMRGVGKLLKNTTPTCLTMTHPILMKSKNIQELGYSLPTSIVTWRKRGGADRCSII